MLTSLMLLAPLALAAGPRDRAEDARDQREDARDRQEDRADARHDGGAADRREDVHDRREDVRDRHEDARDRHNDAPRHATAYRPHGHHVPASYSRHRGPPRPSVVVVHRAPARHAPAPAKAKAPEPTHAFVVSVDAVDAANGLANVAGEFAFGRRTGLIVQGGVGADQTGGIYTVGTELRTYLTGDFDGGLYLGVGGDYGNAHLFTPTSPGFELGPTLGAKHTFDVGLTLQASVGLDGIWTADYRGVAPTAMVGVGWAF